MRAFLLVLLFGSTALGMGYLVLNQSNNLESDEARASLYILGPARTLISEGLYERADLYFHKGASRKKTEAFHGFFQRWKEAICPTLHAHADGKDVEEILPWLRLASQTDPHNIEIYLVASYWLNRDCNRPDLAIQAIDEATQKNPDRYELYLEKGRIYLTTASYEEAAFAIEQASKLSLLPNQKDMEQAAIDRSFIYMALSYLYEALSREDDAIRATAAYLDINQSTHFSARLNALKHGILNSEEAETRLHKLFYKEHECDRDDPDHTSDDHNAHECPDCAH